MPRPQDMTSMLERSCQQSHEHLDSEKMIRRDSIDEIMQEIVQRFFKHCLA